MLCDPEVEISMSPNRHSINIAIERFFRGLKYGNIYNNDHQTISNSGGRMLLYRQKQPSMMLLVYWLQNTHGGIFGSCEKSGFTR